MFAGRWELADASIGLLTVIGCAARWAGHQIAPADQRDRQQMARITVLTSSGPQALTQLRLDNENAPATLATPGRTTHQGVPDERHTA